MPPWSIKMIIWTDNVDIIIMIQIYYISPFIFIRFLTIGLWNKKEMFLLIYNDWRFLFNHLLTIQFETRSLINYIYFSSNISRNYLVVLCAHISNYISWMIERIDLQKGNYYQFTQVSTGRALMMKH